MYQSDDGKPCVRSLYCKVHSLQQKKQVQGRNRSYETLLADIKSGRDPDTVSVDIESTSSSCSSIVVDKQIATDIMSDEATILLKQQVELPTIKLRKLEDELVKGITQHAMAELLQNQTIVMKKEEPQIEAIVVDSTAVEQIKSIPPAELLELFSQVEERADTSAVLTMEQLSTLVEENSKQEMNMYVEEPQQIHTEVDCRTVSFPLSVFCMLKGTEPSMLSSFNDHMGNGFMTSTHTLDQRQQEIKFENRFQTLDPFQSNQIPNQGQPFFDSNQVHSDFNCDLGINSQNLNGIKRSGQDILSNILTVQNIVPLVIDSYCDVFSKCDQNMLTNCSNLFPMLENIHENENSHDKMRYHDSSNDYRSLKSCMYPSIPKPSYINTFGLKRIGGGATLSRKSLYLRRTLLKTKDSDKKFKLKVS